MAESLSGDQEALARLLPELGFRRQGGDDAAMAVSFAPQRRGASARRRKRPSEDQGRKAKPEAASRAKGKAKNQKQQKPASDRTNRKRSVPNPDSPFAKLAELYER